MHVQGARFKYVATMRVSLIVPARSSPSVGAGDTPPFVIRWDDSDHKVRLFRGSDAIIEPLHRPREPAVARQS